MLRLTSKNGAFTAAQTSPHSAAEGGARIHEGLHHHGTWCREGCAIEA